LSPSYAEKQTLCGFRLKPRVAFRRVEGLLLEVHVNIP
jgi:hypothetical protein